MSKSDELIEYLRENGNITAIEIMQKFNTTCPHSLIRDARRKLGYDRITDANCKNEKTKSHYKKYFYWEQ